MYAGLTSSKYKSKISSHLLTYKFNQLQMFFFYFFFLVILPHRTNCKNVILQTNECMSLFSNFVCEIKAKCSLRNKVHIVFVVQMGKK